MFFTGGRPVFYGGDAYKQNYNPQNMA